MIRAALIVALLCLAACQPAPRAASYFKAHPEEANSEVADCAVGTHRGAECDNAKAAQDQIRSDARLSLYRKGF